VRLLRLILALTVAMGVVERSHRDGAFALDTGSTAGSDGDSGSSFFAQVNYGRPPSGGGRDGSGCGWVLVRSLGSVPVDDLGVFQDLQRVVDGVVYRLFLRDCGGVVVSVWVPQVGGGDLAVLAGARVEDLVPVPVVGLQPPAGLQTIGVPTWFWTSGEVWRSRSVTAWVPTPGGVVWATTTARPVRLWFVPGNGQAAVGCGHGGVVRWEASRHIRGGPGDCVFTYVRGATPGDGVVRAGVSIDWEVSWTSNVGGGGRLASLTTSTVVDVDIDEIQALVNG
jgi:hypothetical protein